MRLKEQFLRLKIWSVGNQCGADSKQKRNAGLPPLEQHWAWPQMLQLTLGLTPFSLTFAFWISPNLGFLLKTPPNLPSSTAIAGLR